MGVLYVGCGHLPDVIGLQLLHREAETQGTGLFQLQLVHDAGRVGLGALPGPVAAPVMLGVGVAQ